MANKFEILTKYIPLLKEDNVEFLEIENNDVIEDLIQIPGVNYSRLVEQFTNDVYIFEKNNKDMELTSYSDILKENGLEWNGKSMKEADVSLLNEQCIMALIMAVIRADRFCEGILLKFFESGCILKWLERLKTIDK